MNRGDWEDAQQVVSPLCCPADVTLRGDRAVRQPGGSLLLAHRPLLGLMDPS